MICVESGNQLNVSIKDEGKGIPKDKLATIFKSFSQLDPRDSGGIRSTGLGLTFVKLAVEAHGSSIEVVSEEGKGSTFSFSLELEDSGTVVTITEAQETLELSDQELTWLEEYRIELTSLTIHEIGAIENQLEPLLSKGGNVSKWAEGLLNAAYGGNSDRFSELINQLKGG